MLDFDDVLSGYIGDFGKYQRRVYVLVCLPAIWCAVCTYSWTFTGADVNFRCKNFADDTNYFNTTKAIIKMDKQCSLDNSTDHCVHGYAWDHTVISSSALVDWELVCDRGWLKAVCQSCLYLGVFFGSLILGYAADKFGRKPIIVSGALAITVVSCVSVLSPSIYVFIVIRFFQGFLEPALWQVPFCVAIEMVGPSKRLITGMVIEFFFTFGLMLVGGLAYFIRDWIPLQLALSVPGFFFVLYYWMLPESPRWLLSAGRTSEAASIIRAMAVDNDAHLPDHVLQALIDDCNKVQRDDLIEQHETRHGYFDLVRTSNMRMKTLICCFTWTTITLIYYGISLNPSAVAGDFHTSFLLSSLMELPALVILMFTLNIVGRRLLTVGGFVLAGAALVAIAAIDSDEGAAVVTLNMCGRLAATAVFSIIYLHTSELFPTVVRGTAMGLMVTCSRIGGIASPFALMYMKGRSHRTITLSLFGALSLLSGILTLFLPETAYRQLPETIHDGEALGSNMKEACCMLPHHIKEIEERHENEIVQNGECEKLANGIGA